MKLPDKIKFIGGPLDGEMKQPLGVIFHYQFDLNPFTFTFKTAIYKLGWFEDEISWIFYKIEDKTVERD